VNICRRRVRQISEPSDYDREASWRGSDRKGEGNEKVDAAGVSSLMV
jgi:hypothetical protein